jgi:CysZ protein
MVARDFWSGLTFWSVGWARIFRQRSLFLVALLPFVVSLSCTTLLVWTVWSFLPDWVRALLAQVSVHLSTFWRQALYYPLLLSSGLVIFFAIVYVIYVLQALIAVPFFALLADRTLTLAGKKSDDSRIWREWVRHTFRMARVSLLKAVLFLALGSVLFLFSFFPVLNLAAYTGALFILALDSMDYTFEAMGYGLRRRLVYMFREWPQWAGMATGLALTLLIPGLTLLVMPGAVVGAALIFKLDKNQNMGLTK